MVLQIKACQFDELLAYLNRLYYIDKLLFVKPSINNLIKAKQYYDKKDFKNAKNYLLKTQISLLNICEPKINKFYSKILIASEKLEALYNKATTHLKNIAKISLYLE